MNRIILRKGRERSVAKGHPWVFSGAVERGEAAAGELVEVCDHSGAKIASGWYSPSSQIRVRIVPDAPIAELVAAAVGRRGDFFANAYTNAVRLVNAENDLLPGVVADYYVGHVVCQFTSAGADARKNEIADALMKFAPGCLGVSERLDVDSRAKEGLPTAPAFSVLVGAEPPEFVEIAEGPCRFLVDVRKGHKTGFYLDQRDARAAVGALADGADVLNCFAYTGGFGLFARAAGAAKVTQVDVSADALALAKRNEGLVRSAEVRRDEGPAHEGRARVQGHQPPCDEAPEALRPPRNILLLGRGFAGVLRHYPLRGRGRRTPIVPGDGAHPRRGRPPGRARLPGRRLPQGRGADRARLIQNTKEQRQ